MEVLKSKWSVCEAIARNGHGLLPIPPTAKWWSRFRIRGPFLKGPGTLTGLKRCSAFIQDEAFRALYNKDINWKKKGWLQSRNPLLYSFNFNFKILRVVSFVNGNLGVLWHPHHKAKALIVWLTNIVSSSLSFSALSVECTHEYMMVILEHQPNHGNLDMDKITLMDVTCTLNDLGEFNATHLWMRAPLDSCMTNHSTSGDTITYMNSIIAETRASAGSVLISREFQAEFPFKCSYPRSALMSVASFSPREKVIYTRTGKTEVWLLFFSGLSQVDLQKGVWRSLCYNGILFSCE